MRLVAISAAVLSAAIILGVQSPKAHAEQLQKPEKKEKIVVVQPGDSLTKIALANETTYQRLFYANTKIKDPDMIYPEDKLRVPAKDEKLKERELSASYVAAADAQQKQQAASAKAHSSYTPPPAVVASAGNAGVWDKIAACESGGNWAINTGNGYYGGLQFSLSSWRGVGGTGYPNQASKSEQIARGKILQSRQGWGAWPACTAMLGLR